MTTLKDYLRDLAIEVAEIGQEFINRTTKDGQTMEEMLDEKVDIYVDNIKNRIIGE